MSGDAFNREKDTEAQNEDSETDVAPLPRDRVRQERSHDDGPRQGSHGEKEMVKVHDGRFTTRVELHQERIGTRFNQSAPDPHEGHAYESEPESFGMSEEDQMDSHEKTTHLED